MARLTSQAANLIRPTVNQSQFYVTGLALSQFVHGAEALGIDARALLNDVGLSEDHLAPSAKVPESQYEMLLLQLSAAHRKDSLGAEIGQQLMPSLYGVLTSLLLNSDTVAEGLRNFVVFQALATGNCGGFECSDSAAGAEFCIIMTHRNPIVRQLVTECVITLFCNLLRLISSKRALSPESIWIEHAPASERSRQHLESLVCCPVIWSHGSSRITIDAATCQMKIHGEGREMLQMARQIAHRQLESLASRSSAEESIKWHTRELMLTGTPRRELVASRLRISASTLDRRLKEAGLTWQTLVDNLRAQLAIEYLSDPSLTIVAASEKLGFSEVRAFQRRFKRWTGMTPSEFRKRERI